MANIGRWRFGIFGMAIVFAAMASHPVFAQNKIIILLRHAEKEISQSPDPSLSAAGKERAARLIKRIGRYRPGAFYSSEYARSRETLEPLAAARRKAIEIYDTRKPKELLDRIMTGKEKRVVVAGHSNTIPAMANAIAKRSLFKDLDENEFATIWVIRIKHGKVQKIEILDY